MTALPPDWDSWTLEQKETFLDSLRYDWRNWARPNQLPPEDDWDVWIVLAGRGFGKALALDTPIPTPDGWTTMGDIKVGDRVFDETGSPCSVTFTTPIQLNNRCYRVVFDDGSEIVADADHQWLTWDRNARRGRGFPSVRTTQDILDTLRDCGETNHSIRVTAPLKTDEINLLVDPYVLGAWLGDGSSAEASITIHDTDAEEMLAILANAGETVGTARRNHGSKCATYPLGKRDTVRCKSTGQMLPNGSLHSRLKSLGVFKNKHIPCHYLRASESQRRALLSGLLDTDGHNRDGHIEFCSTNERLADDVHELALSLGYKAVVYGGRATLNGVDHGPKFRVCWTTTDPVFGLKRKNDRFPTGLLKQRTRTTHRYVVSVESMKSVPVTCIQVDSDSHLFLAGKSMIPTHNTRTGAEYIKERMLAEPGCRVGIIGQTIGAARDVCVEGESGLLSVLNPKLVQKYNRSLGQLRLKNGSSAFTFSGGDPEKLRGFQSGYLWLDELCAFVEPQSTYDMALMGLRLGRHPRMVITTTPKPTPLIVELVNRSRSEPDRVRITTGSTFDNSANLPESTLAALRARYEGTTLGRQELYAELVLEEPGALWKRSMIDQHRVESGSIKVEDMTEIVIGVDPNMSQSTERATECGIVVVGRGRDGHGYLLYDGSMLRPSPDAWATKVVSLYHEYKANQVVAEVNQGYDLVVHTIHTVDPSVPIKKVYSVRGKSLRAEPIAALAEQGRIHHVGTGFDVLEDQMVQWLPGSPSPDRLDAYVHGMTKLLLGGGLAEFFAPTSLPRLPSTIR